MNIYVGNLSSGVTSEDLREAFEAFGQVTSANVITDKFSGESRGFGFVEMPEKAEAQAAIDELNGRELKGRELTVNEARPRTDRPRRGGGGRGGGGRGGGGRGGGGRGGGGGGRGGPRRF
jgi:cold-inducible RNA-binding protein